MLDWVIRQWWPGITCRHGGSASVAPDLALGALGLQDFSMDGPFAKWKLLYLPLHKDLTPALSMTFEGHQNLWIKNCTNVHFEIQEAVFYLFIWRSLARLPESAKKVVSKSPAIAQQIWVSGDIKIPQEFPRNSPGIIFPMRTGLKGKLTAGCAYFFI